MQIPYAETHAGLGKRSREMTLASFIQFAHAHPHLMMGFESLFDLFRNTSAWEVPLMPQGSAQPGLETNAQFFLGPEGSGAPVHYHMAAVNYLAYGRKLWRLKPPNISSYDVTPAAIYFNRTDDAALTCIQEAGDVLIVPSQWEHATLNIQVQLYMYCCAVICAQTLKYY